MSRRSEWGTPPTIRARNLDPNPKPTATARAPKRYDLNCYMADDVSTENGNLVLRTRINPTVCVAGGYNPLQTTQSYKYTSGKVDTVGKFSVRNGRIEMNAKLPPPTFRVWPAGWSISDKNNRDQGKCWPLATESASVGRGRVVEGRGRA